jgi:hypothetical protein
LVGEDEATGVYVELFLICFPLKMKERLMRCLSVRRLSLKNLMKKNFEFNELLD